MRRTDTALAWLRVIPSIPRRMFATPRRVLSIVFCVAACLLIGSCSADWMVLGSDPGPPAGPAGATRRLLHIDGQDGDIECWIARSPGAPRQDETEPEAFVLFFPGKGTRAESWTSAVAQSWGHRRVEVWGINYPGFGGSTGPRRLSEVGPAALRAYDTLSRAAGARPVFLQAASFGTTPVLHVAANRPVAGLVLHKPPPLRQLILGSYGWWNLWLLAGPVAARIPADLDSLANGPRSQAPAIFLLHGSDQIIAHPYQRRVADAYAGPKRVIEMPGARHDDPLTREAAQDMNRALDWLWQRSTAQRKLLATTAPVP